MTYVEVNKITILTLIYGQNMAANTTWRFEKFGLGQKSIHALSLVELSQY